MVCIYSEYICHPFKLAPKLWTHEMADTDDVISDIIASPGREALGGEVTISYLVLFYPPI